MAETPPKQWEHDLREEPQPQVETVEVDAGTSSAVHELELEGEAESVTAQPVAPENMPLEERDA